MGTASPKRRFLQSDDDDQELFDNLIQVEPNEYRPSALGVEAHLNLAKTKLIRGGLGSGKTRWGCEDMNDMCLEYPGSLHFIGRKDLTSLKTTTQREYLEFVVRPQTIDTFHVNDNTLYYKNGSQVLFRETKDKNKVKSLELTSYLLDEADENEDEGIYDFLDQRLRQKIRLPTGTIIPRHTGRLIFNPTNEDHWLYKLSKRRDLDVADFQFSTYLNAHNLPPNYIPDLERRLPPWERRRLLDGAWGRVISGKPVLHGFTEAEHVRPIEFRADLPLLRSWDFGYGHPAVLFAQIDHRVGRVGFLSEFLGSEQKLNAAVEGRPSVVDEVKRITRELCGPGHPVMDYGDPHGADEKDTSVSSIEYLRIHHQIFVQYKRQRIITGLDEIQEKILARATTNPDDPRCETTEPLIVVDPRCPILRDAFLGGYHRGQDGLPVKDGYYDHLVDDARYLVVHNMNRSLAAKRGRRRYRPRNIYTAY